MCAGEEYQPCQRIIDIGTAIRALPDDIKAGQGSSIPCPICHTGKLQWGRGGDDVLLICSTRGTGKGYISGCVYIYLPVPRGTKWPR